MKERVFFEEFDSLYFFHGNTPNWAMQDFHFHNQYEIILFLNDNAMLEVGNRLYHAHAGDLFLLNNKEYHRTSCVEGKTYNRYVLMFEPEVLQSVSTVFDYDFTMFFENRPGNFIHKLHLTEDNLKKITNLMDKIEKYINDQKDRQVKVKLKLAILELIAAINGMYEFFMKTQDSDMSKDKSREEENMAAVEFKEPVLYRERIEQIKKYVTAHVEDKMEMDDIAGEFYISRHYLSHYFKKETGFTLAQYITNQKVIAAKALLKDRHTVSEVANRLSYNSDSHFISVFKRNTGITPKQYAKEKIDKNK